jgi:hypothetical protein
MTSMPGGLSRLVAEVMAPQRGVVRFVGLFFRRGLSTKVADKSRFALPGYVTHRQDVWDREAQRQGDAVTSLPSMSVSVQFGAESRVVTDMAQASPAAIAAGECRCEYACRCTEL